MPRTRLVRAPGRPLAETGIDARRALLEAALAAFAEAGIAASSTVAIARRAGLSPAMVQYYFGGRDALIEAVAAECMAPVLGQVLAPLDEQLGPDQVLGAVVDRVFDCVEQCPWLPPIWIREIATEGGLLRDPLLERLPRSRILDFGRRLAQGCPPGRAPAPALAFLTVVGLSLFPLATRSLWQQLPGGEEISLDQLRAHAIAVLSHGLVPGRQE